MYNDPNVGRINKKIPIITIYSSHTSKRLKQLFLSYLSMSRDATPPCTPNHPLQGDLIGEGLQDL